MHSEFFSMYHRRHKQAYILQFMVIALALTLAGASMPSFAQVDSAYEVAGVTVDVTAVSAATAREEALAEGEVAAFNLLLDRLVIEEDRERLPVFDRQETVRYVRNFSISDEKTSQVRYLASLTYRFHPAAVRRLLMDSGVAFAETPSKPVLVLPIFRSAGALYLWGEFNPWLEAWRSLPPSDGLVPLELPRGDLTDITTVGSEQAAAGDLPRLAAAAARYGASDTLVAISSLHGESAVGGLRVGISVTRYGSSLDAQTLVLSYAAELDESLPALLKRASESLSLEIQSAWKRENRIEFGQGAILVVRVPVGSLDDWLWVRKRLARVAIIQDVELVLLSLSEVRVVLHYLGDYDQLTISLEQADLRLAEQDGVSVLFPSSATAAQNSNASRASP